MGPHHSCPGLGLRILELVALQWTELAMGARASPKQLGDAQAVLQHTWLSLLHCQPGTGPGGCTAEEDMAELWHLEQNGKDAGRGLHFQLHLVQPGLATCRCKACQMYSQQLR